MSTTRGTPRAGAWTYEDYCALPDDGRRYQVLQGDLVVTPAPNRLHQGIVLRLGACLSERIERDGLGFVYCSPVDVVLGSRIVVQPDLVFISTARAEGLPLTCIDRAPDLAVEVLSPSTASVDRVRKAAIYARAGVPWYWMVDPDARTVEEYELHGEAYRLRSRTVAPGIFQPTLFPGLAIALEAVLRP
jgi:Uma2 family endonuclease